MSVLKGIGILALCLSMISGYAQSGQSKKEQKEAQRVAFFTEKLELTPEEAEKFWPVYREYKKAQTDLRKNERPKKDKSIGEMTDDEVQELLDGMINYKQKELDLKKKYHEKFKTILPIKKVAKLYHAEEQFKKHLKAQRKGKLEGKPNKPGPKPDTQEK